MAERSTKSHRITIRLHPHLAGILDERCRQTGQNPSEVVRSALALMLASDGPQPAPSIPAGHSKSAEDGYVFPRELEELLPRYRAFGMEIWKERRRCTGFLLAICEVAREHSQNAQDRALCAEILRIGRQFGLLR